MKTCNTFYMQLTREICRGERMRELSAGAVKLFVWLNELEQRYCNDEAIVCSFYRTDAKLASDLNADIKSIKKWKAELKENASDLIEIKVTNELGGRKARTMYSILK